MSALLTNRQQPIRRHERRRHRRVRPTKVAALAFIIMLGATAIVALVGRQTMDTRRQQTLEASLDRADAALAGRLEVLERDLHEAAIDLGNPRSMTSREFSQRTAAVRSRFGPELVSLAMVQETPVEEFGEAVRVIRNSGLPLYRAINPSHGETNLLVTHELFDPPILQGIDVAANDAGRSVLGHATRSNPISVSETIELEFARRVHPTDRDSTILIARHLGDQRHPPIGRPTTYWLLAAVSVFRLLDETHAGIDGPSEFAILSGDGSLVAATDQSIDYGDGASGPGEATTLDRSVFPQNQASPAWSLVAADRSPVPIEPLVIAASGAALSVVFAALVWTLAWSRDGALGLAADEAASRGRSERQLEALVGNLTELVVVFDAEWKIQFLSPSVAAALGFSEEELLGKPATSFFRCGLATVAGLEASRSGTMLECPITTADGVHRCYEATLTDLLDDPAVRGRVWTGHDITDRKVAEERLEHDATHDHLTGLPNRTLLLERLERARERARRDGTLIALLFLDIDRFKLINDSLGHACGDELLVAVSARLTAAARAVDTVARFGGDEFIVVCESLADEREAEQITERLLRTLEPPIRVGERDMVIKASVGLAVSGAEAEAEALIRDADIAMYEAKNSNRGGYKLFHESLRAEVVDRLDTAALLRQALEREEFRLYYQPIVDLATRRTVGLEALVRWQHPHRGLLLPEGFLSVAESAGLAGELGRWMLAELRRHAPLLRAVRPSDGDFFVSVSLSARQLGRPGLIDEVTATMSALGRPDVVVLDGTEIASPAESDSIAFALHTSGLDLGESGSREILRSAVDAGATVVVDSFGNGAMTMAQLRAVPLDGIKVDKLFVEGILERHDRAIVGAMVTLARGLGLRVGACGIESEHQRLTLLELGCEVGQGDFFGAPAPAQWIARRLADGPQLQR